MTPPPRPNRPRAPRLAAPRAVARRRSPWVGHRGRALLTACVAVVLLGCSPNDYEDILVIGHRGSPYEAPENSLEGFELAYRYGADGVEFDVQYTSDGRNVVMHDGTLDRTTSCTGRVRDFTAEQLRACTLPNDEPVILLEEALTAMADWFDIVFLEIKVPDEGVDPILRNRQGFLRASSDSAIVG